MISNQRITTFEHHKLVFDLGNKEEKSLHDALENFHGNYSPYFSLIKNGVQFKSYVGVIQVGKITIEVLPKADTYGEERWRAILIDMIRTVWGFDVKSTGTSALKLKKNSVLDLYIELFVSELEKLLRKGIVKKYFHLDENRTSLKGSIHFSKHLLKNSTHHEKFYCKTTVYNTEHLLHKILYKALKLVSNVNSNIFLKSRIGNLLLYFPEMPDINVQDSTFNKINLNRKTQSYEKALEISRLLLLNFHPDLLKGKNNVLALMFDMNTLWEQFILITLRKKLQEYNVKAQSNRNFWRSSEGFHSRMRPDILLQHKETNEVIVLDTKWKYLLRVIPEATDLRQMYVYHQFYNSTKTALLYPGSEFSITKGNYFLPTEIKSLSTNECSVVQLQTNKHLKVWQENIKAEISKIIDEENPK